MKKRKIVACIAAIGMIASLIVDSKEKYKKEDNKQREKKEYIYE